MNPSLVPRGLIFFTNSMPDQALHLWNCDSFVEPRAAWSNEEIIRVEQTNLYNYQFISDDGSYNLELPLPWRKSAIYSMELTLGFVSYNRGVKDGKQLSRPLVGSKEVNWFWSHHRQIPTRKCYDIFKGNSKSESHETIVNFCLVLQKHTSYAKQNNLSAKVPSWVESVPEKVILLRRRLSVHQWIHLHVIRDKFLPPRKERLRSRVIESLSRARH